MTTGPGTGPEDVEVWAIPLRQPPEVVAALLGDLDAQERRRAAGDPRYGVAHGAVRRILAARAGCAPRELRRTAGPHGKPGLVGPGSELVWNLSASRDWALLALLAADRAARPGLAVGVDVQHLVPEDAALRLARRYFPVAEAQQVATAVPLETGWSEPGASGPGAIYTRLWTCKEAYVKVFGGRLVEGLAVPAPLGGGGVMDGPLGRCRVAGLPGPAPDCPAAVAVTGELPIRFRPRTWTYAPAPVG